jgi:plastocyanin
MHAHRIPNGGRRRVIVAGIGTVAALVVACADSREIGAQQRGHSIYMTAVEFKGSTTTDKLSAPSIDPSKLSRGYAYKTPGQADPSVPQRWEVASYQFSPACVTARQGNSIMLSVFIANGDRHEVQLIDPEGQVVLDKAAWERRREYTKFFQVQKAGDYHLECAIHGPSMTATYHGPAALRQR